MLIKKLTEGFRIRAAQEDTWHSMSLPGMAMEVYFRDGVIPDPYVGTNEYAVRDFLRNDFIIEGTFAVSEEELVREHVQLVFHGIDTVCDLFLNDKNIGHTSDMHRAYRFESEQKKGKIVCQKCW